jgi:hypothetical protein
MVGHGSVQVAGAEIQEAVRAFHHIPDASELIMPKRLF